MDTTGTAPMLGRTHRPGHCPAGCCTSYDAPRPGPIERRGRTRSRAAKRREERDWRRDQNA